MDKDMEKTPEKISREPLVFNKKNLNGARLPNLGLSHCSSCGITYRNIAHIRIHRGDLDDFECCICKYVFKSQIKLDEHSNMYRNNSVKIMCCVCDNLHTLESEQTIHDSKGCCPKRKKSGSTSKSRLTI